MDLKLKIAAGAAGCAAIAIAAVLLFGLGSPVVPVSGPNTTVAVTGPTNTSGTTGSATATPSASPTDHLGSWADGGSEAAVDTTRARELAVNTVLVYAQFDSAETASARGDRIRKVTGDRVSSGITGLSLPNHVGTVNWSARTGIIGQPYAAFVADNKTTITFDVLAQYWGSYGTPEYDSQQAQGTWRVTIEHDGNLDAPVPIRVLTITEPEFALR